MRASILLIDSDPAFVYLLGRYAEQSGFSLRYAPSLEAARALLAQEIPALVVLNRLLIAAGHAALAALQRDIAAHDIPLASFSQANTGPGPPALDSDYELALPLLYSDFCQALAALGIRPERTNEPTG